MMPTPEFEWQADGDQKWDDLPPLSEENEPGDPRCSRRVWLVALVLITVPALVLFLLLNRRVDEAVALAEEEVGVTHALLLEAVEDQDYELFTSLISDRQRNWFEDQPELLSLSLFWGRTALGLEPGASATTSENDLQIDLDPDLARATVSQTRPFVVSTSSGLPTTVDLERTFLYERIDQGWYLTGLEEDTSFWGDWERQEGEVLTLVYPARDGSTGRRLAPLLDDLVRSLCAEPALKCPNGFEFELKLDRDEQALKRLSEGFYTVVILVRDGKGTLSLPAPSMAGRPLDQAGFQALAQGYAAWLGAVLINNFAAVNQESVNQSVIEEILAGHDLPLPPWPQSMMPRPSNAALPVGSAAPQHDILMMCSGGSQQRLLRFKTAEAQWANEWLFNTIRTTGSAGSFPPPGIRRLPDYSGVLVNFARQGEEELSWQTYLWQNGQEQLWLEHEEATDFWPLQFPYSTGEADQFLIGYSYPENDNGTIDSWWIDLQACLEGACAKMEADGFPLWSPDGRHTLLIDMTRYGEPELHLGDQLGHSQVSLGSGFPVSWPDDETFVYLRGQIPGVSDPTQRGIWQELVLSKIDPDTQSVLESQVVIDSEGFRFGIAAERAKFQLGIVTARPYKEGWLVAIRELGNHLQASSYLFYFQPQTGDLTWLKEIEMGMILPPLLLDIGGPYLAISVLQANNFILLFLDQESGDIVYQTDHFPVDWTADGQWLLFAENSALRVAAPALDFEWTIEHNLQGCYTAVWTNRTS
jgi:hypothetical protein